MKTEQQKKDEMTEKRVRQAIQTTPFMRGTQHGHDFDNSLVLEPEKILFFRNMKKGGE